MSGTRSPSPRVPATDVACLIIAHGDRGGTRENRLAGAVADQLTVSGRFKEVAVGYVRSDPSFQTVAAGLSAHELVVLPLFMSDGYYVRQAIPERLQISDGRDGKGRPVRVLEAFGIGRALPGIVAELAGEAVKEATRRDATLLLVAHGSTKDRASAEAAISVAGRIDAMNHFATVEIALLEEPPFLADQLSALPGPLAVVGLFIGEGMHGAEDLQEAVENSGRADIHLSVPLARYPRLPEMIARDVLAG